MKEILKKNRLDDKVILEQIESRYSELKPERRKANCIGTALFLAGLIKEDHNIGNYKAREYLKNLKQFPFSIKSVKVGYLLTYEFYQDLKYNVAHMAIVVNVKPLRLTDRVCYKGPVYLYSTIEDIDNAQGYFDRRMLYDPFSLLRFP
ncbi:hypothetical protein J4468_02065 [Candidatus Woesearchaeota archaeon]|nr:hypothetical protein [Candidatus Woesearchaeota archaeon]